MKLLILIDWYRPAYKAGGPIKSIYHICGLLEHKVDINIITGDRDLGDKRAFTEVPLKRWTTKAKARVLYLKKGLMSMDDLYRGIKSVQADTIYINGIFSWFFNLLPLMLLPLLGWKGRVIIAPRGMLQAGALRLKRTKKRMYLWLYKVLLQDSIVFHATDEQEAEDIHKQLGISKERIVTVGNLPGKILEEPGPLEYGHPLKLVLISRLTEKKNIRGLLEELVLLEQDIELDIYGDFQSRKYENECRGIANELPPNITVRFGGELHPSEVKEVLLNHHFYILLTQGENFGHSIFEAMSVGVPIIISDNTPWSHVCKNGGGRLWRKKGDLQIILNELISLSNNDYSNMQHAVLNEAKGYAIKQNYTVKYTGLFSKYSGRT